MTTITRSWPAAITLTADLAVKAPLLVYDLCQELVHLVEEIVQAMLFNLDHLPMIVLVVGDSSILMIHSGIVVIEII